MTMLRDDARPRGRVAVKNAAPLPPHQGGRGTGARVWRVRARPAGPRPPSLGTLMPCSLLRASHSAASLPERSACCPALVLDDACASATQALPRYPNGTGNAALRPWCFDSARARLRKESTKWRRDLIASPNRVYREQRRGRPVRARTSQQSFFHEWLGCFGCQIPGNSSSCCSSRGTCVFGVCACTDGTFGVDCSGTTANAGTTSSSSSSETQQASRRSLSIFVYETLPLDIGALSFSLRTWISNLRGGFEVYSTEWRFLNYLLRDSAVRTLDPEKADLFFVPTLGSLGRMPGSEGAHRCMQPAHIEMLVHYVRTHHPYWDRSGGRDHVFFLTGDQGACGMGSTGTRPIFITAWGLLGTSKKMSAFETFKDDFVESKAIERAIIEGEWCHAPHKDVVVPPYGDVQFSNSPRPDAPLEQEHSSGFEHTLLHVGGIWGAGNHGTRKISFYSQGMRQALYLRWGDERGERYGIWIQNRSMHSGQLAHKTKHSKFCLAPSGHGWGMRTGKNAVLGCVPLIAQPYVVQPYEMLLPYELFGRRVSFEDIANLPEIVNVSDTHVRTMRRHLARVRRAFVWRVEGGGLAYNHTLLHLCHRALELRGHLKAGAEADCKPLAQGLPDSSPSQRMPKWFPAPLVAATLSLQAKRSNALRDGRVDGAL